MVLNLQAMNAADELLRKYGGHYDRETERTLLAMAWLVGYGAGLEAGKAMVDTAFEQISAAL